MATVLNDPDFYRRRGEDERRLAEAALDPEIRDIHLDFAQRYDLLHREATLAARARA